MEAHALRVFHCPNNAHVDCYRSRIHHALSSPESSPLAIRITPSTSNKCRRHVTVTSVHRSTVEDESNSSTVGEIHRRRRDVLVMPLIAIGACVLRSAVARADEIVPVAVTEVKADVVTPVKTEAVTPVQVVEVKKEKVINSRIYDATVIGEPMAVGKDKGKVWEKMMNGRIVYLGEAEQVPTRDDKELEVEIVKSLAKRCAEANRQITLVLEAFPADLQEQLDKFVDKRFNSF